MLPLKRGAGLIAVEMDCLVVPVIIKGSDYVLPFEKVIPRHRGVVSVIFGKPLKFKGGESYTEVTQKIEKAMRDLAL